MQKFGEESMKKTRVFIGVLFALVVGLTIYNSVNETITVNQPQHAVSNPEPTVQSTSSPVANEVNEETQPNEVEVSFSIGIADHSKVVYERPNTNTVAAVSAQ